MKKGIVILVVLLLLLGIGAAVFGFVMPYIQAETKMNPGQMTAQLQENGQMLLSWPEGENADSYRIELYQERDGAQTLVYREYSQEARFLLPALPQGLNMTVQVASVGEFQTLLETGVRYSETVLEATACLDAPVIRSVDCFTDVAETALQLQVQTEDDWQYRLVDGSGTLVSQQDVQEDSLVLQFGDSGLALPEEGEICRLQVTPVREVDGLRILGQSSMDIPVLREDLTEWKLDPVLTQESKYSFSLTWEENRGMDYEVQRMEDSDWVTVAEIAAEEERSYRSEWLEPEKVWQYRVVSVDGSGKHIAESEPLIFETLPMTQYATVWPVMNLTAYADAAWGSTAGTVQQGKAYCVLEERNGMFGVDIGGKTGYIDSNYCMINLPEYMGDLCSYNITNSVYAIYAVHEFAIPEVTGVVTGGYEDVCQEDGSFLVPLLYPTARKLFTAANKALEQGYRLKIYDSFRPYQATREIYDLTEKVLNMPLPDKTYTGIDKSTMDLPEPREGTSELTLGWLMTGRFYVLNAFLARNGSTHNLGIALDLTLEDVETGEEIAMQSSIHDLSHYSVLSENNDAANVLGKIMLGSGFGGLSSEWWHFQDDIARATFSLPYIPNGVSAQCWMKDDTGWRYRTAKGSYYENETVTIDGVSYTFDENGYTDYR